MYTIQTDDGKTIRVGKTKFYQWLNSQCDAEIIQDEFDVEMDYEMESQLEVATVDKPGGHSQSTPQSNQLSVLPNVCHLSSPMGHQCDEDACSTVFFPDDNDGDDYDHNDYSTDHLRQFSELGLEQNKIGNRQLFRIFVEFNLSRSCINKILNVLRNYTDPSHIHQLPADFRTAVGKYPNFKEIGSKLEIENKNACEQGSNGEDENLDDELELEIGNSDKNLKNDDNFIYFGLKKSLETGVAKFDEAENNLGLSINIDGVPVFKNSTKQFWPILGKFGKNPVFTIALWYGSSKPLDMNDFLKDFVAEMNSLVENGVLINGKKYSVYLKSGHFDSPARCAVLNAPGFNSYSGCHKCTVAGTHINHRMCFLGINAEPRTTEQFSDVYRHKKKVNSSELLKIKNFDVVKNVLLDSLHVVDLGVMKKLITKFWIPKLRPTDKQRLSGILASLPQYCPKEFQRKPRTLRHLANFNGKDYRMFVLYTAPLVMKDFLYDSEYCHFLYLHVAIRTLNDEPQIKSNSRVAWAKQLLESFVKDFPTIYGEEHTSYNVHALPHMTDDVKTTSKTLIEFSSYAFESYLGFLCKLVKSGRLPAKQVARRIHESHVFEVGRESNLTIKGLNKRIKDGVLEKVPQELQYGYEHYHSYRTFDSERKADRFCEIRGKRVMKIEYFSKHCISEEKYVCGVYLPPGKAFFDVPCKSTEVHEFVTQYPKDCEKICFTEVENITGKYFHMPVGLNQYLFSKLLHKYC
ncbi:uncharacterized protein LOC135836394 isoform X1 [Planococcus citri]|uniref:uncharacterized protein LOC135836394 isoform X1 n=1 Tax=Planococcus citri TaxID=170843 RepID=UPI0031F7D927